MRGAEGVRSRRGRIVNWASMSSSPSTLPSAIIAVVVYHSAAIRLTFQSLKS